MLVLPMTADQNISAIPLTIFVKTFLPTLSTSAGATMTTLQSLVTQLSAIPQQHFIIHRVNCKMYTPIQCNCPLLLRVQYELLYLDYVGSMVLLQNDDRTKVVNQVLGHKRDSLHCHKAGCIMPCKRDHMEL